MADGGSNRVLHLLQDHQVRVVATDQELQVKLDRHVPGQDRRQPLVVLLDVLVLLRLRVAGRREGGRSALGW